MRLQAPKCKYSFPDIEKGELTATCITQRFEYQRWETSSLERNLFQGASNSLASWVWSDLALEGGGMEMTLWLCPVTDTDAKMAMGRVDILCIWGWLPVLVQHSVFTFLWWEGSKQAAGICFLFPSKHLLSAPCWQQLLPGACKTEGAAPEMEQNNHLLVWNLPENWVPHHQGLHSPSAWRKLVCSRGLSFTSVRWVLLTWHVRVQLRSLQSGKLNQEL